MSKDLSARYQKKTKVVKGNNIFLKRSKTKSENMVTNHIKIFAEDEKQKLVEYGNRKIKLLHE